MKQQSLAMTGYFDKGKKTPREQFLAEMEQVIPDVVARLAQRVLGATVRADRAALSEVEPSGWPTATPL
ncbi:MAG TPA: hypothetical protein VKV24_19935, partial [Casimicrobiaceae bacterium]|nr:hypothetical protein [Casimicrobiaceae bacterium]